MPSFQFNFDRLSFWLGFIAATLFWWLLSRIRPLLPVWRDQLRQYMDAMSMRNLAGVENYLRKETLRRAQRQHVASALFALDEILIEPGLLVPPGGQDPTVVETTSVSIAGQVVPYLPDWPEITAPYGVPVISPAQALQSGRNIAIIGPAGSGKTVALAHLASQIARNDPAIGKYTAALPLYLHVLDFDFKEEENADPLQNLIKSVTSSASALMQPQIPRYLQSVAKDKQRKIVLFLDGLDEIPPADLSAVVAFLTNFVKKNPRVQVIVTASCDFLDGLPKAGFLPLSIAGWSQQQRRVLVNKWGEVWNNELVPELKKQVDVPDFDPIIMENWLNSENDYTSPLEWTLRVWGAHAGDLAGNDVMNVLDSSITRFLSNPVFITPLEDLAREMVLKPAASMTFDEMEAFLSNIKIERSTLPAENDGPPAENVQAAESAEAPVVDAPVVKKPGKKSRRGTITTQGEQIIQALIQGGVLVQHTKNQLRFASPVYLGFLAGMKVAPEEAGAMVHKLDWAEYLLVLQYAAACDDAPEWIYPMIDEPVAPLYRNLLFAARWLRDASPNAEWRSGTMRTLVSLIQNDTLPAGVRAKMIAAFFVSRDPSMPKLFKQLLNAKSSVVRRCALMGCGALGNPQMINDILPLLADSDPEVRYTACLALAATPSDTSLNAVVEVLLSGDEAIRQAAAESLAKLEPEGHKVLQEAAEEEDLLTRRAAVFGLLQVGKDWSRQALEKIAVEDGQWVVRNAAAQALETLQQTTPMIPKALPRPSECGWLLTFASKLGLGILPGQPATDVLLAVLKSGSVQEQIAALQYLKDQANDGVIMAIYHLFYGSEDQVREPALHTLWWIAASGIKLPPPTQFGLG